MSSSLWRVTWNLTGTKGPRQTMEFAQEENAMGWAEGLLKGGANGIFVIELIIGRSVHIDAKQSELPIQK